MTKHIFTTKTGQLRKWFAIPFLIVLTPVIAVGIVTYPVWGCMTKKLDANE
jgi:hypothetical protein